jgi:hypothetical protein
VRGAGRGDAVRAILVAVALTGCGSYFKKAPESHPAADGRVAELEARQATWLEKIKGADMPRLQDCDLALWAGEAVAAGADVDLSGFESGGAVRRNPSNPCTPASRDMVLGWGYGEWRLKDRAGLQRLAGYGEAHNWDMSSDVQDSYIDPVGQAVLARAIDALTGGKDRRSYEGTSLVCASFAKDFEQHLQVAEALLGGEVADALEARPALLDIPQGCVDVIRGFAQSSPGDALFAAAYGTYSGHQDAALSLLLDEGYRCPTYVRGAAIYCAVHRAFAAEVVLRAFGK